MLWNISNFKNNIHYTYLNNNDLQVTHIITPSLKNNIILDNSLYLKLKPILLKKFLNKQLYYWIKNMKKLTFIYDKNQLETYNKYLLLRNYSRLHWMLNIKLSVNLKSNKVLTTVAKKKHSFNNYQVVLNLRLLDLNGNNPKVGQSKIKINKRNFLQNKLHYNWVYTNNLKKKIILFYKKLPNYSISYNNLRFQTVNSFLSEKSKNSLILKKNETQLTKVKKFKSLTRLDKYYENFFNKIKEDIIKETELKNQKLKDKIFYKNFPIKKKNMSSKSNRKLLKIQNKNLLLHKIKMLRLKNQIKEFQWNQNNRFKRFGTLLPILINSYDMYSKSSVPSSLLDDKLRVNTKQLIKNKITWEVLDLNYKKLNLYTFYKADYINYFEESYKNRLNYLTLLGKENNENLKYLVNLDYENKYKKPFQSNADHNKKLQNCDLYLNKSYLMIFHKVKIQCYLNFIDLINYKKFTNNAYQKLLVIIDIIKNLDITYKEQITYIFISLYKTKFITVKKLMKNLKLTNILFKIINNTPINTVDIKNEKTIKVILQKVIQNINPSSL